ncbi:MULTISPECIES: DUF6879 family protein [Streptomyces]|uniref:DUF6879 family protein n=1 Tax=Streptomyces TaxID=1883 RepID=UPI0015CF0DDD|nr:DUF6879 family protein [Streptomyces sp. b84]
MDGVSISPDERLVVIPYFRDAAEHGLVFRRVRVVEFPVSPYLQWEMNVFRVRSELGEEIRVLDARKISDLEREAPVPEVIVLGHAVMYAVTYDDELKGAGARRFTDTDQVSRTSREFEALYAMGEGFPEFFEREIAPLDPPTVS